MLADADRWRDSEANRSGVDLKYEDKECGSVANNINNTYIGNMEASQYYCIAKWFILY